MIKSVRDEKLNRLGIFIGKWEIELIHPLFQSKIFGQTKFDWLENEKFMIQQTTMKDPDFPSSTIIYDYDSNVGSYVQHYFDSRGVTRLYQMNFQDDIWKLWRDTSDFSQLDFSQRFIGHINKSQDVIQGTWEKSDDGLSWEYDFRLIFRKVN